MKKSAKTQILLILILVFILACNLPGSQTSDATPSAVEELPIAATTVEVAPPSVTSTPAINHLATPSTSPPAGAVIYDVESSLTAPEKRAPYGDSYDINRLERPFLQDMTYVSDLDIVTYSVSQDADWYYVSIELIGTDPNNPLGINYAVELDTNYDGFGDHIIWATPPYTPNWDTLPVKIYSDKNHDTGGLSGEKSDAPLTTTDGYETLTFNGGVGDSDPDMAWVRVNAGRQATVQFAFKKSWSGTVFMLGVVADLGLQDVTKLDYVDRFTEEEAGSPIKDKEVYPLNMLFAVDNACREAFGFKPTGYEPQLCPRDEPAPPRPRSTPAVCQQPTYCTSPGYIWHQDTCYCESIIIY
jgi:hypothetical protein